MGIREQFRKTVTMTVPQRQCMVIVTLLSTLCLLTAWPRFRSDAMSLEWYVYLFLVFIFLIPLFKRN
jgi:hypothetical protein